MILQTVQNNLYPENHYTYGVADISDVNHEYPNYPYAITIGKELDQKIVNTLMNGPTLEYYNHYQQVNKDLTLTAKNIQTALSIQGVNSLLIEPTIVLSAKENEKYLQALTAEVSHKMVATKAGLGWIGKTALFISFKFGPRLRLITILINKKPEQVGVPVEESQCGACTLCVDNCPAQAASGKRWNVQLHRDDFFNPHKCRAKCRELGYKYNLGKPTCGICVYACPVGNKMKI